ncbi:major facilitator superfamily domain-containing protein [Zychaea mexicana]|uniref:major facilitator superfamily domain-containing protein n=1 Tax=Zychaea mexicana TaxID=64656 RepID=UPI0022FE781B|nr:major facilitator superfamily domain-containing protein [Zychaea mexicana]KAI9489157.1 major facilitator superfamily domain-containing protein [Zychaea mexicana]
MTASFRQDTDIIQDSSDETVQGGSVVDMRSNEDDEAVVGIGEKKNDSKQHSAHNQYSGARKLVIFLIVTAMQMMQHVTIGGMYPVFPAIRSSFDTTETITNATTAVYTFLTGLLPSVWVTLSNIYGRRPMYMVSTLIMILGNAGSALSINIGMLLASRAVAAIGGGACVSLGAGVITDVFNDSQRGRALSWNNALPISVAAISPIITGALTQYLGWRSVFWFLAICYAVLLVSLVYGLPETKTPNQPACTKATTTTKSDNKQKYLVINPFASLKLLRYPNILLASLYMGIMYFVNYAANASFAWAYHTQYHFSSTYVGLCYMLGAFGYCTGAYAAGTLSDRVYQRRIQNATEKNERVYPEMRLSKLVLTPSVCLMAGGYAAYGWCIQENTHFVLGMFMQMFGHGASVQVSLLVVIDLQEVLGHGVLFSICGGLLLIASSFVYYVQKNSEKWEQMLKE